MDREELETGEPRSDEEIPELERPTVALRAVFSLLIAVILSVLNSLLAILVVYQLIYSFVAQRLPSERVQEFGNAVTAYYDQMLRYLTHNDSQIPFPFSDFPTPREAGHPAYEARAGT
jgi:uncharacterized membrane protein